MEVTKEQFSEWRAHPVTQAVFATLQAEIEEQKERWLNQEFFKMTSGGLRKDQLFEAGVLGRMNSHNDIINFQYGHLSNEFRTADERDLEHVGGQPEGESGSGEAVQGREDE